METQMQFESYLRNENLSDSTIFSYMSAIKVYFTRYDGISKENLLAYKGYLMEYYSKRYINYRSAF